MTFSESKGWAVQITRADGTSYLLSSCPGSYPAVWIKDNKMSASLQAKELRATGLEARVVPVVFHYPKVITL